MVDWLQLSQNSGYGLTDITITASSYSDVVDRVTSLLVSGQAKTATVSITQGIDCTMDVLPGAIELPITGGTATFTVSGTGIVSWSATSANNWFAFSPSSGICSSTTVVSVSCNANYTDELREGVIRITNGFETRTVTLYQDYYQTSTASTECLTFHITEGGNICFRKFGAESLFGDGPRAEIMYSINGGPWTQIVVTSTTQTLEVFSVSAGDVVRFYSPTGTYGGTFGSQVPTVSDSRTTAKFTVSGNIMSLYNFADGNKCAGWRFTKLFNGVTGLTDASELILPDTVTTACYGGMFWGCKSLVSGPKLPAKVLDYYDDIATPIGTDCYNRMFYECTSLSAAPELPATVLAPHCYERMFYGCTGMTTASELPARVLADSCYEMMFTNCTSLVTPPSVLPAYSLCNDAYAYMFYGCASLSASPIILAATTGGYPSAMNSMFNRCSSMASIVCLIQDVDTGFSGWVNGVRSRGTFTKDVNATWPNGINGIPNYWTVSGATNSNMPEPEPNIEPLTIMADSSGSVVATMYTPSTTKHVEYSINNGSWSTQNVYNQTTLSVNVNRGDTVRFRIAEGEYMDEGAGDRISFTNTTCIFRVKGCYWSLKNGASSMFYSSRTLTDASELQMPRVLRSSFGMDNMFAYCTSLVAPPLSLPLTLASRYYSTSVGFFRSMFRGCTSMKTMPRIDEEIMSNECFTEAFTACLSLTKTVDLNTRIFWNNESLHRMYWGCTGLTSSGRICKKVTGVPLTYPLVTAETCAEMYRGCTSLVKAPEIPFEKMAFRSCYAMFSGCTSLNYVKCLATELDVSSTNDWLADVSPSGTFVKNASMTGWPTGSSGIPAGWSVVNDA